MNTGLIIKIAYVLALMAVCLRIIYDTRNVNKSLAYLLLAVFVPMAGMIFYLMFGANYRKRQIYSRKLIDDDKRLKELNDWLISSTKMNLKLHARELGGKSRLVNLLLQDNKSPLTSGNKARLLVNGEEKFPEVITALEQARHHIHMEYFIYQDDLIGNTVKEVLIRKAREGVTVRLIYDGYGSRSIRRRLVRELKAGGVEAYPFNRVRFPLFANRINYRNHRKIIVIDGKTGFTGGININDKYINDGRNERKLFWRDTHLRIDGPGILSLQHIFLSDWNFCSNQKIAPETAFYNPGDDPSGNVSVQMAMSGPDSPNSTIKLSILRAISMAKKEIQITTPYFIPGGSIMDEIKMASLGGVKVKLLVPGISDSRIVNAAAQSYYEELLAAGVEIYRYLKGFVHAKTIIIDQDFAVVGTANMNHRSFNFDFEVNAFVYDPHFARELGLLFAEDLKESEKIDYQAWISRPKMVLMLEKVARLLSPVL
jgi:cardiolipin synthase